MKLVFTASFPNYYMTKNQKSYPIPCFVLKPIVTPQRLTSRSGARVGLEPVPGVEADAMYRWKDHSCSSTPIWRCRIQSRDIEGLSVEGMVERPRSLHRQVFCFSLPFARARACL
jgi:hypothetical protein